MTRVGFEPRSGCGPERERVLVRRVQSGHAGTDRQCRIRCCSRGGSDRHVLVVPRRQGGEGQGLRLHPSSVPGQGDADDGDAGAVHVQGHPHLRRDRRSARAGAGRDGALRHHPVPDQRHREGPGQAGAHRVPRQVLGHLERRPEPGHGGASPDRRCGRDLGRQAQGGPHVGDGPAAAGPARRQEDVPGVRQVRRRPACRSWSTRASPVLGCR